MNYEKLEQSGYNQSQINQIEKATEKDIDLLKCINPEMSLEQIRTIRKVLERYRFQKESLVQLIQAAADGIDLSILDDNLVLMNPDTLKVFLYGLECGYDLEKYKFKNFNKAQAKEIRFGIFESKKIELFYNEKYSPREIRFIVNNILPLVQTQTEQLLRKRYKIQSIIKLKKYPEIIKYVDRNILPDMVDAYKELYDLLLEKNKLNEFEEITYNLKTSGQLKTVMRAIKQDLDYKKLLSYNFNRHKLSVLLQGMQDNINIDVYKDNEYSAEQMDMIRLLQTKIEKKKDYKDCDINIIKNPEMSAKEMKQKIDLYEVLIDLKYRIDLNKMFLENSASQIEEILNRIEKDPFDRYWAVYEKKEIDIER